MLRWMAMTVVCAFALSLPATPVFALTAKQKMDTCKFGADDQKLQGKARGAFISKCMANERPGKPKPAAKPPA